MEKAESKKLVAKFSDRERYYDNFVDKIFDKYDTDKDGQIDSYEVKAFVNDLLNNVDEIDTLSYS